MIVSGMPGVSALGSFVPALGYAATVSASPGNFSIEFAAIPNYQCVLSPKPPIALILRITKFAASFDPAILVSENDIPHT